MAVAAMSKSTIASALATATEQKQAVCMKTLEILAEMAAKKAGKKEMFGKVAAVGTDPPQKVGQCGGDARMPTGRGDPSHWRGPSTAAGPAAFVFSGRSPINLM